MLGICCYGATACQHSAPAQRAKGTARQHSVQKAQRGGTGMLAANRSLQDQEEEESRRREGASGGLSLHCRSCSGEGGTAPKTGNLPVQAVQGLPADQYHPPRHCHP
jgi:hypothetical protein